MESKPAAAPENKGTGGKVAIVGAIITAIAGIVTTIVTISAPIVNRRLEIQTTQTREAFVVEATRVAGAAIQITSTPLPVDPASADSSGSAVNEPAQAEKPVLPAAPTSPASSASTPAPATVGNGAKAQTPGNPASAAMLKVGDTWTAENGITVQLTDIEVPAGNEVHLHFAFTNPTNKVMNIKLDHNRNITLVDDKGNQYKWATDFTWEVTIYPNTTRKDEVKKRGDVSLAKYFIVKLDLPGMGSVQWKN